MREAVWQIYKTNKRRKSDSFYLIEQELEEVVDEAYPDALLRASLEALESTFKSQKLA